MENLTTISKEQFYTDYKRSDNLMLIDVRSPLEYKAQHIKSSINIPLEDVSPERVEMLLAERGIKDDEAIYLICKSGMRAKNAQQKMGSSSRPVICIDKGIDGMKSDNDIDYNYSNRGVISLERQVRIAIGTLMVAGIFLGTFSHPAGYGFSGLVGLGLLISGITDWCGFGLLIAKMPWNTVKPC